MKSVEELLTDPANGLVREARQPQLQMAASIRDVLREGGIYYVEAPVATGKTYAYLVPALLASGQRIVVATAKKQLQDQIIAKDLPAIQAALGANMSEALGGMRLASVLKGKSNYTCQAAAEALLEKSEEGPGSYRAFVRLSNYGDRAEYDGSLPRWWGAASAEDCVGKRCERFDSCGYIRLKKDATQSKIVVVNHHVLGADMYYGLGKLVGGPYDVLIVDEAHTLAAGIRSAFTHRVAEDSISGLKEVLRRTGHAFPVLDAVNTSWKQMFELVGGRGVTEDAVRVPPVFDINLADVCLAGLTQLAEQLGSVQKLYTEDAEQGAPDDTEEPEEIFGERVMPLSAAEQEEMQQAQEAVAENSGRALTVLSQAHRRLDGLIRGLRAAQGFAGVMADIPTDKLEAVKANTAVYASYDDRGRFGINSAPVNVGGLASNYLKQLKAVVLCSATLAVDGEFNHLVKVTGQAPTKAEILPTAFNYDAMGIVYIPRDIPSLSRSHPEYGDAMKRKIQRVVDLCDWSKGGAFVLTTANDELDQFTLALREKFPGRVFAQGHKKNIWDGDAPTALAKFRATKNAILVGSKSFWEGVDVPGGDLRLVIVAKLPFPLLSDPIVKARERLAGRMAFEDVQMVDMLIDLRQGVGRLIRSSRDRGGVAILDSRIWEKRYGQAVRRSLPWKKTITDDANIARTYLGRFAAYFGVK